jgi:transcriptional repressor NrdR
MKCPKCGGDDDKVIDSRILRDGAVTRRRRECCACGFRYTTYEEIVRDDVTVVKKDGSRQLFDRAKVVNSIRRACGKRAPDEDQIGRMIDRVVSRIEGSEVGTDKIAEYVMDELHAADEVAYVRFASVYKRFTDVAQFLTAITEIVRK